MPWENTFYFRFNTPACIALWVILIILDVIYSDQDLYKNDSKKQPYSTNDGMATSSVNVKVH